MLTYEKERKDLLAASMEILNSNMVMGTWGNISCRVEEKMMLITPSGMDYRTLTPADMVLLDFNLQVMEGHLRPSIESSLHRNIYQKRERVKAIVHVHSNFASVYAVAGKTIPVILEETAQVIGHPIEVAPYAHCGTQELATVVAENLGRKRAILLANHGLVGVGRNLADAMRVCYIAEKTAMIAFWASQLGSVNILSPHQIKELQGALKDYGQK